MNAFFSLLNQLFDLLFWPFRNLSPIWPVLAFSLPAAVFMLFVFRHFSNQAAIRRAKDRIGAHLLEVRLYQDQLAVVLRAYGRLLRATGIYILYSLKPLAVLLLPLVLWMAQMELRLGREPAVVDSPIILKAILSPETPVDGIELVVPEGVSITAPPVRIADAHEVAWRVEAHRAGDFLLELRSGVTVTTKHLASTETLTRRSPLRTSRWIDLLLYPGEPLLDAKALQSVEVTYPVRSVSVFGWGMHWLIPFFVVTLIFGYALKGVMGAEF